MLKKLFENFSFGHTKPKAGLGGALKGAFGGAPATLFKDEMHPPQPFEDEMQPQAGKMGGVLGGIQKAGKFLGQPHVIKGLATAGAAFSKPGSAGQQMGAMTAQMAEGDAYRSAMGKMLAGEDITQLPEARALSPQALSQILSTQQQIQKVHFERQMQDAKIRLERDKLDLAEKTTAPWTDAHELQRGLSDARETGATARTEISADASRDVAETHTESRERIAQMQIDARVDERRAIEAQMASMGTSPEDRKLTHSRLKDYWNESVRKIAMKHPNMKLSSDALGNLQLEVPAEGSIILEQIEAEYSSRKIEGIARGQIDQGIYPDLRQEVEEYRKEHGLQTSTGTRYRFNPATDELEPID